MMYPDENLEQKLQEILQYLQAIHSNIASLVEIQAKLLERVECKQPPASRKQQARRSRS
jgi:hypothetical protein